MILYILRGEVLLWIQLLELKNWNEYTIYEQKELLNHWWFYYGKMLYTAEELKRFNEMVDQNPYQILSIAIISYINGYLAVNHYYKQFEITT